MFVYGFTVSVDAYIKYEYINVIYPYSLISILITIEGSWFKKEILLGSPTTTVIILTSSVSDSIISYSWQNSRLLKIVIL